MKKFIPLVLFLLILSCLSGYLMSKPSLVGRIGIDLFYKQYQFLKIWWQGAFLVFITWMFILFLQILIQRKFTIVRSRIILFFSILLALTGLYFTWDDFQQTNTHRWLKERFHIGAYLFWLGWIVISGFLLIQNKPKEIES
ncbi:MAG: cytochrome d ubiquinol oxidase subunit II [Flavisolibacter sp.]